MKSSLYALIAVSQVFAASSAFAYQSELLNRLQDSHLEAVAEAVTPFIDQNEATDLRLQASDILASETLQTAALGLSPYYNSIGIRRLTVLNPETFRAALRRDAVKIGQTPAFAQALDSKVARLVYALVEAAPRKYVLYSVYTSNGEDGTGLAFGIADVATQQLLAFGLASK